MVPLLHWGTEGIIEGFHLLDPLGGLGLCYPTVLKVTQLDKQAGCRI